MREEQVQFLTDKEEEFVERLEQSGFTRKVATVLVFLMNTSETTSRAIERGTDLRQPEVSLAMKVLIARGWVDVREAPSENKGRPSKLYQLALPAGKILQVIRKEKEEETKQQLALVGRLKEYIQ